MIVFGHTLSEEILAGRKFGGFAKFKYFQHPPNLIFLQILFWRTSRISGKKVSKFN